VQSHVNGHGDGEVDRLVDEGVCLHGVQLQGQQQQGVEWLVKGPCLWEVEASAVEALVAAAVSRPHQKEVASGRGCFSPV